MNSLENQLILMFSALGAINGFFLSLYFAFFIKNRNKANYFLSALMFVISVRTIKSVFLFYYSSTSELFIHIGLTACSLIGPFLYIYVRAMTNKTGRNPFVWLFHIAPILLIMMAIIYSHPYKTSRSFWNWFGAILYTEWFVYIVCASLLILDTFKKIFSRNEKLNDKEIWLINIIIGVAFVWLAYWTNKYTSYIVGALSFSFVFYILLLVWFFRRRNKFVFMEEQIKYANKKIEKQESKDIALKLEEYFKKDSPYKNPNLKLPQVAEELSLSKHYLSQYLNDNLEKSFNDFINEYRVNAAEEMLRANDKLTLEAIGNECGFKSNSSFYSAFKKFKGITPGKIKMTK